MKIKTITMLMIVLIGSSHSEVLNSLQELFDINNVSGSVVIKKVGSDTIYLNNLNEAHKRVKPASTFKILNTLIALDGKYISELDTIVWDKKVRDINQWNMDQTLETAFKYSCVWVYENLEKMIGIANYPKYLNATNYGNKKVGQKDTTFWLYGDLRISSLEQAGFLDGVYLRKYDFSEHSYEVLKNIMIDSKSSEYIIYGKTGWVDDIGWYVGYIETKKGAWVFATRLEGVNATNNRLKLRKDITIKALSVLHIIEVG